MITLVEALNYRCLRYVQRPLKSFHVLVGPNASGKITFMDVVGFLSDILLYGLDGAISRQTSNPIELLFQHHGTQFELAIEATIPEHLHGQKKLSRQPYARLERRVVLLCIGTSLSGFPCRDATIRLFWSSRQCYKSGSGTRLDPDTLTRHALQSVRT